MLKFLLIYGVLCFFFPILLTIGLWIIGLFILFFVLLGLGIKLQMPWALNFLTMTFERNLYHSLLNNAGYWKKMHGQTWRDRRQNERDVYDQGEASFTEVHDEHMAQDPRTRHTDPREYQRNQDVVIDVKADPKQ